jgi:hypothetical protein
MNRNVIIIIVLTVLALLILILYSFGPMAGIKKNAVTTPLSLKPNGTKLVSINDRLIRLSQYSNREVKENYFIISLPQDWQVKSGQSAGAYAFTFAEGSGTIELMDVPDNSTLELYVLSQKEPTLRKTLVNYARKDYKRSVLNSNEACKLTYNSTENGKAITTFKIFIAGPDHASVITFNVRSNKYAAFMPIINAIVNSFAWEAAK